MESHTLHIKLAAIERSLKQLEEQLKLMSKKPLDGWVDSQDVCVALHISKRTLQSYRSEGLLPYSSIGGKYYYRVEDIENILNQNRRNHG